MTDADEQGLYFDYDALDPSFELELPVPQPLDRLVTDISKERKRLKDIVKHKRKEFELKAEQPPMIRLKDKISFTLGISNVGLIMFLLGKAPGAFWLNYTIKLPIMIFLRWYFYRKEKFHYFLLDFCYFANALFFLYLHMFPQSCTLFQLSFSYTVGPLCWAVGIWRNSMVFHSLDKITSLFIHMTPSLTVWCMRWYSDQYSQWNTCSSTISFYDASIWPILPYILWQFGYFVIVQVMRRDKFKNDPQRMTSFLWMVKDKGHVVHKAMNVFGPKYAMWMFGLWQLAFTILTMLPVKLFYEHFWAHTIFVGGMGLVSAWNGSCFYIEVFSQRYQSHMKECEEHYKQLSQMLEQEQNAAKVKSS